MTVYTKTPPPIPPSQIVLQDVLTNVFEPEAARLHKLLGVIQDTHSMAHGSRAFLLDGKVIINGDTGAAKARPKKHLDPDLADEARQLINRQVALQADQRRVINFFGTLAPSCHDWQDYRDVLPDMVVEVLKTPDIKALSRTRMEGYIFESQPIKMKMYQDATGVLFLYLATRLVFQ